MQFTIKIGGIGRNERKCLSFCFYNWDVRWKYKVRTFLRVSVAAFFMLVKTGNNPMSMNNRVDEVNCGIFGDEIELQAAAQRNLSGQRS